MRKLLIAAAALLALIVPTHANEMKCPNGFAHHAKLVAINFPNQSLLKM